MTFQKGNQLWKKGLQSKKEQKSRMAQFIALVASGGITEYTDKLEKQSQGVELTKPEVEFMDRIERLIEYVQPKLARTELTGKDGKDLPQPIINVSRDNSNDKAQES